MLAALGCSVIWMVWILTSYVVVFMRACVQLQWHLTLESSNSFPHRSGQQLVKVIYYCMPSHPPFYSYVVMIDTNAAANPIHIDELLKNFLCWMKEANNNNSNHINTLIECWRMKISWLQRQADRQTRPTGILTMCTHNSHTYKCHGRSNSIKSFTSNYTKNIWIKSYTKQHAISFLPIRIPFNQLCIRFKWKMGEIEKN